MRHSWGRWWLRAFSSAKGVGRRCRLDIESLEERCLPSHLLLTVNSAADDPSGVTPGVVTLRDAITAVNNDSADDPNSPDVIQFAIPGSPTITLSNDLPALSHAAFIDGSTQTAVTVDGAAASGANYGQGYGVLTVNAAATERDVTFTDGTLTVNSGGALNVIGDLILGDSNGDNTVVQDYGALSVSGSVSGGDDTGVNTYGAATFNVTGSVTMGAYGYLFNGQSTTDQSTCGIGGSLTVGTRGCVDNFGLSTLNVGGNVTVGAYGSVFNGADYDSADAALLTVGGGISGGLWSSLMNDGTSVISVTNDVTLGSGGYIDNGEYSSDACTLKVGGNLSLGVSGTNDSYIYNRGASVMQVTGNLTLQGNYTFFYNGMYDSDTATCTVSGSVSLDVNSFVYDYGTLTVTGSFGMGADSFFADYRAMSVSGAFDPGSGSSASNDIVGGTLTARTTLTTDDATWNVLAGGLLVAQGDFTVDGTLSSAGLSAIVVDESGQLTTAAGGQLNIGGTLLTWTNPADITQGTALDGTQLDATATTMAGGSFVPVSGTFTYTPASGTLLPVGQAQSLNVTFTPSNASTYAGGSAQVSLNVLQGHVTLTPTLAMNPLDIVYGTPLGNGALSGTAFVTVNNQTVNVAGTFTFTSAAGTVLNAGEGQSETVTFTPSDTADYTTAQGTVTVNVAKADQTITITQAAPTEAVYGSSFLVMATASSGLAVSISGSGAASGSDSSAANITMSSGTGTGTIAFSEAGNANYNAAMVVIETVTAQKANQAITVSAAAPDSAVYGTSFTVSAVASSGLAVNIAAGGAASGSGSGSANVTMTSGTGTATVTFSQAGNDNYNAASVVLDNVAAEKAAQAISVTEMAPTSAVYGASFTVAATASSGDAVAISASGAASGSGNGSANVTMMSGTGSGTVTFTQAGDNDYNAATVVVESVSAQKANQTITVTQAAPASAAPGASFTVAATSSSGLAVAISAGGAASGSGSGTATIKMTGTGAGTVTFSQAGDNNYNAAAVVLENVTTGKLSQTITVTQAPPAHAVYGSSFIVSAVSSSGLSVAISASDAASGSGLGAATIRINAATGTGTVTFTQAGNAAYAAASLTVSVKVIGPGIWVVGTELWYVASSTANPGNHVEIKAAGRSGTGSTGIVVNGKTHTQSFSAIRYFGYNGNDTIRVAGSLMIPLYVTDGNGNDTIQAGNNANTITLGNGRDTVQLGSGNNTLTLGTGNDSVWLGNGNNAVTLGKGNDTVLAGNGDNAISGGNGNDNVLLGKGNNSVSLGNGNDNVYAGNGSNVIVTGNGHDNIWAGNGNNLIVAGLGQHSVWVGNGSNILVDGSVRLTQSGDSLRDVLESWTQHGKSAADVADIRRRLAVTDNATHANLLHAGSGLDWFWYTYGKDSTDRKATDLLN